MVVGGEVVTLKSLEESSNLLISEMPINVSLSLNSCRIFEDWAGQHDLISVDCRYPRSCEDEVFFLAELQSQRFRTFDQVLCTYLLSSFQEVNESDNI